jgi:hypothetical protein
VARGAPGHFHRHLPGRTTLPSPPGPHTGRPCSSWRPCRRRTSGPRPGRSSRMRAASVCVSGPACLLVLHRAPVTGTQRAAGVRRIRRDVDPGYDPAGVYFRESVGFRSVRCRTKRFGGRERHFSWRLPVAVRFFMHHSGRSGACRWNVAVLRRQQTFAADTGSCC